MAFLGKRSRKPAAFRRRKRMRRVARVPRTLRQSMVTFQRSFNYSYWQPATTTTADFWKSFSFSLGDMPSSSEITNLFDEYKINAIKVKFLPRWNSFDGSNKATPGTTNAAGVNLHIMNDPRNQIVPAGTYTRTTLNSFLEGGRVKSYNGDKAVSVYFKPQIYNVITPSVSNMWMKAPWLPTGNTTTPHFGFQAFAQDYNLTGGFTQSWDVFVTYYISARNPR